MALVAYYGWASCQAPTLRYLYAVARHRLLAVCQLVEGVCHVMLGIALGKWFGQWGVQYALLGVALGTLIPGLVGRGLWLQAAVMPPARRAGGCTLRGAGRKSPAGGSGPVGPVFRGPEDHGMDPLGGLRHAGPRVAQGPNYPQLIVNALLCAAIYAAALACIGLTRDERRALANLLRRRRADDAGEPSAEAETK